MYLIHGQRTLAGCNVAAADLSHSGHRLCHEWQNAAQLDLASRNLAKPDLRKRPSFETNRGGGTAGRINRLRRFAAAA
jgi:hypothetical protein